MRQELLDLLEDPSAEQQQFVERAESIDRPTSGLAANVGAGIDEGQAALQIATKDSLEGIGFTRYSANLEQMASDNMRRAEVVEADGLLSGVGREIGRYSTAIAASAATGGIGGIAAGAATASGLEYGQARLNGAEANLGTLGGSILEGAANMVPVTRGLGATSMLARGAVSGVGAQFGEDIAMGRESTPESLMEAGLYGAAGELAFGKAGQAMGQAGKSLGGITDLESPIGIRRKFMRGSTPTSEIEAAAQAKAAQFEAEAPALRERFGDAVYEPTKRDILQSEMGDKLRGGYLRTERFGPDIAVREDLSTQGAERAFDAVIGGGDVDTNALKVKAQSGIAKDLEAARAQRNAMYETESPGDAFPLKIKQNQSLLKKVEKKLEGETPSMRDLREMIANSHTLGDLKNAHKRANKYLGESTDPEKSRVYREVRDTIRDAMYNKDNFGRPNTEADAQALDLAIDDFQAKNDAYSKRWGKLFDSEYSHVHQDKIADALMKDISDPDKVFANKELMANISPSTAEDLFNVILAKERGVDKDRRNVAREAHKAQEAIKNLTTTINEAMSDMTTRMDELRAGGGSIREGAAASGEGQVQGMQSMLADLEQRNQMLSRSRTASGPQAQELGQGPEQTQAAMVDTVIKTAAGIRNVLHNLATSSDVKAVKAREKKEYDQWRKKAESKLDQAEKDAAEGDIDSAEANIKQSWFAARMAMVRGLQGVEDEPEKEELKQTPNNKPKSEAKKPVVAKEGESSEEAKPEGEVPDEIPKLLMKGRIVDGNVYLGGDPKKPSSWMKLK